MPVKNIWSSHRRTIGLVALSVGLALAAGSAMTYIRASSQSIGDVAAMENLLRTGPASTTVVAESDSRPDPGENAADARHPLWQANQRDSSSTPGGPDTAIPVELRIESLGVRAEIGPYGVDRGTGQMAVPDNVTEVAWYQFGPAPGQPGSAVLAAHVDLLGQGPGVFFKLGELTRGDLVEVEFDDGSVMAFEVQGRVSYPKEHLPLDVIFSEQGAPVLTLVTCGGGFDSSTSRYDSNVVVYARPAMDTQQSIAG